MIQQIINIIQNWYSVLKTYIVGILIVLIAYLYYSNLSYKNELVQQQNIFLEEKHQLDLIVSAHKLASDIAKKELQEAQLKAKETVIKIEKVYVPKVQYVKEFIKETNETDCQAAERLIDSFVY